MLFKEVVMHQHGQVVFKLIIDMVLVEVNKLIAYKNLKIMGVIMVQNSL